MEPELSKHFEDASNSTSSKGRPKKQIDPVKLNSFFAALESEEGVSSLHLIQVTGLSKSEVMRLLLKEQKEGRVVNLGSKKGSKYKTQK